MRYRRTAALSSKCRAMRPRSSFAVAWKISGPGVNPSVHSAKTQGRATAILPSATPSQPVSRTIRRQAIRVEHIAVAENGDLQGLLDQPDIFPARRPGPPVRGDPRMKRHRVGPGLLETPGQGDRGLGAVLPAGAELDEHGQRDRLADPFHDHTGQVGCFQHGRAAAAAADGAVGAAEINVHPEEALGLDPPGSLRHALRLRSEDLAHQQGQFLVPPLEKRGNMAVFGGDRLGTAHLGKKQPESAEAAQQFAEGDVAEIGHGRKYQPLRDGFPPDAQRLVEICGQIEFHVLSESLLLEIANSRNAYAPVRAFIWLQVH